MSTSTLTSVFTRLGLRPQPAPQRSPAAFLEEAADLERKGYRLVGTPFELGVPGGRARVQRFEKNASFNCPWAPELGGITRVAFAVEGTPVPSAGRLALGSFLVGPEGRYYYFDGRRLQRSLVSVRELSVSAEGVRLLADVRPVVGDRLSTAAETLSFFFERSLPNGEAQWAAIDSTGARHTLALDAHGEPAQHLVR